MAISFTNALLELTDPARVHTIDSLFDLVGRVSGGVNNAPPGSTYFLFSGSMPDDVTRAVEVVGEIEARATGNVYARVRHQRV